MMSEIVSILILIVYGLALLFIFFYSLIQLHLAVIYSGRQKRPEIKDQLEDSSQPLIEWPFVTIQLPLYNEMHVSERLIDAVARMDYPSDKLEIQVLDDSTDETSVIVSGCISKWVKQGINILHIQRNTREGFKAGALSFGLNLCKGAFIAVFDADFLPGPDFLKSTIPVFLNPKVGMVQTRWEHLNENYSLLTKMQAFGLDAHFTVEQKGRNQGGYFINFNGTAGVWRKACILDSGGWHSDTLTEDLDLSYRAQLRKWKFVYQENIGAPAELPVDIYALKSQQFRWTKGAAENAIKHLGSVVNSDLTFPVKLHSVFHLLNSTIFVCVALISILSVPILFIKHGYPDWREVFFYASFFLISLLFLSYFYMMSLRHRHLPALTKVIMFIFRFPVFLSISMGMSLHNANAVLQAYMGKRSPFIRTPKFNITSSSDQWKGKTYHHTNISPLTVTEGLLAIYFVYGIINAVMIDDYGMVIFYLMLFSGYAMVFGYSLQHHFKRISQ